MSCLKPAWNHPALSHSRHVTCSICLEMYLLIGFEFFVYLKNQILVSHSGRPSLRLSAMCSCQGTLARSGVFPKGVVTWNSLFSLIFNLWCLPEPLQVVDCAAFPLCAKNVPSSAQIYSSQRYSERWQPVGMRELIGGLEMGPWIDVHCLVAKQGYIFKRDNYPRSVSELKSGS